MAIYKIEEIEFIGCLPESDWLENTLDELDSDQYLVKIAYHELSLQQNIESFFEKQEDITVMTQPLDWWKEQPNITEALSVYSSGSIFLYPYYFVILEKVPTVEYDVLSSYAGYIVNGDNSALTDWEIGEIDAALDREKVDFSLADYKFEQGFGQCELTGGRGDLMTITVLLDS